MEDILFYIFYLFFMEIAFWGLIYGTGYLLTPILSFGKWLPDRLIKNEETGRLLRSQSGIKLIDRSGKTYLGAWGVSLLGFCFWVLVILLIVYI
jgi:hypothetical protein